MNKITRLILLPLALVLACPVFVLAQEDARVAVMPVVMSAEGAQLEQLNRLAKGITGVVYSTLADQGLTPISLGDNVLAIGEDGAKAQARELGADYIFLCNINKVAERFNVTGQLVALSSSGKSSSRSTLTADAMNQFPQVTERLVQMTTDHLFGGGAPVVSVEIVGNTMMNSQAILNTLRVKAGGTYSDAKATGDIKRIYALGYFEDVQVVVNNVGNGKAVRYIVEERSQLGNVVFRGNKKFDDDELRKVVGIKPNDIPSERAIADSVENIKSLYSEKGYPNIQVMTSVENESGEGASVLIYEIAEGGKIHIKNIEFDGNDSYSDWTLSRKIDTSTHNFLLSWISGSGKLNQEKLSGDSKKLESFYHNNGFLRAQVGDPIITGGEDGGLTVTFPIFEGERFKVGDVNFVGQTLPEDNFKKMMKFINLNDNSWFNREAMQQDVKNIQTYYADKGYAHVMVEPRINGPRDGNVLDVDFDITLNHKVYFDRITIVGNDKTRDKVVRRQLSVVEGDQFSSSKIEASQAALMRSTYFEQAILTPGPSDSDDKMNLRVELKERPTGSFQIGGGYSNYNSVFGVIRLTQDNLFGYGRRVAVEANVGSKNNYFDISFTDPWVFDIPLTMGFDIFKYRNKYEYYSKESTGGAIRAGYPVWGNFYLSGRFSFEKIDYEDSNIAGYTSINEDMQRYTTDVKASVSLRRDTRNHFFFPTQGTVARLTYTKALEILGGDTNYSHYEAEGAVWYPLPFYRGSSFMLHGQVGYMKEDGDKGLPRYEKYMIGGINTVRGYDWYSISPKDPTYGHTIGGEKMMVFNAEVAFPILRDEGLYGVAFYDMGNVWTKEQKYSISDVKKSYGAGLRYLSPMGPFRIEYGRTINPEPGESKGQWEFTMGSMF